MKRIMMIMAITAITTAVFAAVPTPVPGNVKTGKTVKMMIKVPVQMVDGAYGNNSVLSYKQISISGKNSGLSYRQLSISGKNSGLSYRQLSISGKNSGLSYRQLSISGRLKIGFAIT